MKETKPTAKAATTVVSTPPLIGGRTRRARRRGGGRPRRAAGPPRRGPERAPRARGARRRGPPRTPPPPPRAGGRGAAPGARGGGGKGPPADPQHRQQDRDEPGGEVEAARGRIREHPRPVLGHERRLDLLLVLAQRDLAADEGTFLVGHGGGGDVERGVAFHAHHLVLDVRQRGPRRGARGEHEQHQREQEAPHAFSPSSGGSVRSSHAWSTGPRRWAAILPRRSITNVSGKAREPYLSANCPSRSRRLGYVSLKRRTNLSAESDRSW